MFAFAVKGSAVFALTLAFAAPAAPAHGASNTLDNGTIRVAVDLDQGGRISSVSRSSGVRIDNLVADSEQAYSFGGNQAGSSVSESENNGRSVDRAAESGSGRR